MLAVLGVAGDLDGDDVPGDVLTRVGTEGSTEYPGADEGAPLLVLAPARQPPLANSRSYSAACPARMWMTITSSSLMTVAPLVSPAPILAAGPLGVNPCWTARCNQPTRTRSAYLISARHMPVMRLPIRRRRSCRSEFGEVPAAVRGWLTSQGYGAVTDGAPPERLTGGADVHAAPLCGGCCSWFAYDIGSIENLGRWCGPGRDGSEPSRSQARKSGVPRFARAETTAACAACAAIVPRPGPQVGAHHQGQLHDW